MPNIALKRGCLGRLPADPGEDPPRSTRVDVPLWGCAQWVSALLQFRGGQLNLGGRGLMQHLTRIVKLPGVNILGLLEFAAFVGLLVGAIELGETAARPLLLAGMGIGIVGIVVFDMWWRVRQPEPSVLQRLLSPFTGGCFILVPMWLLFSVAFLAFVIGLVVTAA